jgi:hypothetical protein
MLDLLSNIGCLILFFNLILFGLVFFKNTSPYKIFTLYLGTCFLIQIVTLVLSYMDSNNLFLSHFYFIGQFVILSFFYLKILEKDSFQRKIVKSGLIIGLLVLGIKYFNDPSLLFKFNLFEIFVTSFLLIIYATFHLYNMLNEEKTFYYINMGILIYLFGSTILFLVGNLTNVLSSKLNKIPWILNAFLYVVYQLFISLEWKKSFSNKGSVIKINN